jgi:hypothetical protein
MINSDDAFRSIYHHHPEIMIMMFIDTASLVTQLIYERSRMHADSDEPRPRAADIDKRVFTEPMVVRSSGYRHCRPLVLA